MSVLASDLAWERKWYEEDENPRNGITDDHEQILSFDITAPAEKKSSGGAEAHREGGCP